jgi:hypothetical protein
MSKNTISWRENSRENLDVFVTCMGLSPNSFLLDCLLHKDSAGTMTIINM